VSVGQQAFIGLGAYCVLILAQHGVNPFAALPAAVIVTGVILDEHLHVRLFPVGYWLWPDTAPSRGRRARRTPASAKAGDQSSPI
jgi:hypothetical protein